MTKPATQLKLHSYRWCGLTAQGRKAAGTLLAINDNQVLEILSQQNITLWQLKKRPLSLYTRYKQSVTYADITDFTRQLATMLTAGVPLLQTLELISKQNHKAELQAIIRYLISSLNNGASLAESLRQASPQFDTLYIALIVSAEQSGQLGPVFSRLADYRQKVMQLKARVVKALIYPLLVVIAAVVVTYLMLTLVIPQFSQLFATFNASLPWLTQQVVDLSLWAEQYMLPTLAITGILFWLLRYWLIKSTCARVKYHELQLRLPILGNLLRKALLARFTHTLAMNLHAGIAILPSLTTSAQVTPNEYYQRAMAQMQKDTASGMPLYLAMQRSCVFPQQMLHMVMIAEESGELDNMLMKIAALYEHEVDNSVDNLTRLIEPLLVAILGCIVAGLVIAVYLPIFNLMSILG